MAPLKTSTTRSQWGATVTVAYLVRCNAVARVWNKFWADGMQGFRPDFAWLRWFGCCPRNATRLMSCVAVPQERLERLSLVHRFSLFGCSETLGPELAGLASTRAMHRAS